MSRRVCRSKDSRLREQDEKEMHHLLPVSSNTATTSSDMGLESSDAAQKMHHLLPVPSDTATTSSDTLRSSEMGLELSETAQEMHHLLPVPSDTATTSSDTLRSSDMGLESSDTAQEMHQLLPVPSDTATTSSDTLRSSEMGLESSDTAQEMHQLLPVPSDTAVASTDTLRSSDMGLESSDTAQEMHQPSDTAVASSDTLRSSDMGLESSDTPLKSSNRLKPDGSLYRPPFTDVKIEVTPANVHVMEAATRTPATGAAGGDEPTDIRIKALRAAIDSCDVAGVKSLLASGAPITRAVNGTPALHRCMEYDNKYREHPVDPAKKKEIIEAMVAAAKELNVLDYPDEKGQTPLCVALEYGSGVTGAVEALVNAGARLCELNARNDSALHVAARSQRCDTLKYFLDNHKMPNSVNIFGDIPIHTAALYGDVELFELLIQTFGTDQLRRRTNNGSTVWHYIARHNCYDLAQYLFRTVNFRDNLNVVASWGTPLEAAVNGGYISMAKLLLRNGARLAVKGDKETVVKTIASRFNNPLLFFEDLFDECVIEFDHDIYVDYKVLVSSDMSQIKLLEDFMRFGLSRLLKHPTIESLIYFKWRCLLPVFYTIIVTYVTFLMSLNIFVITTFNTIDTSNATCGGPEVTFNATETSCVGSCGWRHWTLVVFIYISTGVLITQECVWIYLQKLHHFGRPETWLKLVVIILALAVPVFLGCSPTPDSMTWQRHVACVAVLLAWLQAMLLLSRFHGWGYYVLMLERVAINILKILAATIFLLFGFSTCLMIQYQSRPPFDGPVAAFTKTLVMMASEFDYEDLFGEDHDAELKNTKTLVRCIFLLFVIFIAIVLMNFMIGVAVSDVNELNNIGNIRRLEMQVQLLSTLEGLGDTVLSKWWRRLLLIRFHSHVGRPLSAPVRVWAVDDLYDPDILNYKDYFRETFSSELHNAILNIAKKRKQNVDKLDAVYDAVVGMSHQTLDSVSIASSSPFTILNERMKSLEVKMDRILESMANNVNTSIQGQGSFS